MKGLIIGCGNIGATYDSRKSESILTHCHAFLKSQKISEFAICDSDQVALKAAEDEWGVKGFLNLDKALKDFKPEIVSVCTTSSSHFSILMKLSKYSPKVVICEKPLTGSLEQTQEIIKLFKKNDIRLIVNFIRRFDKRMVTLRDEILKGTYGAAISASVIYSKGIINNGSHALDIAQFLFGKILSCEKLSNRISCSAEDPTVDAFLTFESCSSFHLIGADEQKYSIFEIDLILERTRIRVTQFGMNFEVQSIIYDTTFPDYKTLSKPDNSDTNILNAMENLVEYAITCNDEYALERALLDVIETERAINSLIKQKEKK